jgi:hypothetical protein
MARKHGECVANMMRRPRRYVLYVDVPLSSKHVDNPSQGSVRVGAHFSLASHFEIERAVFAVDPTENSACGLLVDCLSRATTFPQGSAR